MSSIILPADTFSDLAVAFMLSTRRLSRVILGAIVTQTDRAVKV